MSNKSIICIDSPNQTNQYVIMVKKQQSLKITLSKTKQRKDKKRKKQRGKTKLLARLPTNCDSQQNNLCISRPKRKQWSSQEKKCFNLYWINYILLNPLKLYSFSYPLIRGNIAKSISKFMNRRLPQQLRRNADQCKSRYNAIKRSVMNMKKDGQRYKDFDLIDFLIEESQEFGMDQGQMAKKLSELRKMKHKKSNFMSLTDELNNIEENQQIKQLLQLMKSLLNSQENEEQISE